MTTKLLPIAQITCGYIGIRVTIVDRIDHGGHGLDDRARHALESLKERASRS
jgi:hypothetical protein